MGWLKSHSELRDHPKSKKAAKTLGIPVPQLVGHLHYLWWWAASYAPDGNLSDFSLADIADGAGWEGDPEIFVTALLESGMGTKKGFLEYDENDELIIHDWSQHGGSDIEDQKARADRQRRYRERLKQHAKDASVTVTLPSRYGNDDRNVMHNVTGNVMCEREEREEREEKRGDREDSCGSDEPTLSAPHADSPKLKPKPRGIDCPYSDIAELWNEICTSLPRVVELSETRKKAIKARWKESDLRQNLDWWRDLFKSIEASDFLTGRTGKGGRFGFDWFMSPKNMLKTIEGNYANDRSLHGASIPFEAIQAAWNATLAPRGKPPITEMHSERRAGVSRIWSGVPRWNSLDTWKKFFVWLSADKGFLDLSGCGFDWLLIYENFVKVRESTYGGKSG